MPKFNSINANLMAMTFLHTGDDHNDLFLEERKEERKRKVAQRFGTIYYLNQKTKEL